MSVSMKIIRSILTAWRLAVVARPIFLFHKPTSRCDCRCRFCDFWKYQTSEDDCLATADILSLLDKAARAGMIHYIVWGGEPLSVAALPEFLVRAKKNGMRTVVCTSGYRLKERAREIAPLTDQLLLSLEAVGSKQDELRGRSGLWERILQGLDEYKACGSGSIFLWSNISKENKDQVRDLACFAKEHDIGVEFFPAALYSEYNENIVLDREEQAQVFYEIMQLKKKGLPVYNTMYALGLMRSRRPFRCNLARLSVQVSPEGWLYACDPRFLRNFKSYGHISDVDFSHSSFLKNYYHNRKYLSDCNACLMPCVAHLSDSLIMQSLRRYFNRMYYR
jgi:MoaA/NifB/PqqE/SkfB family radical SAM enzyme